MLNTLLSRLPRARREAARVDAFLFAIRDTAPSAYLQNAPAPERTLCVVRDCEEHPTQAMPRIYGGALLNTLLVPAAL